MDIILRGEVDKTGGEVEVLEDLQNSSYVLKIINHKTGYKEEMRKYDSKKDAIWRAAKMIINK